MQKIFSHKNQSVLISGASIAGPVLAYWLARYGWNVTVIEHAPTLRDGGYAVDFRGAVMHVLEQMNLLEDIKRKQTHMGAISFVDENNKRLADFPAMFLSGEVEILRGDLVQLLYERTCDTAEYVFNDSIRSLTDTGDAVNVTFEHGAPRTFDLVVGADGLHSNVRRLAFGPEESIVHELGAYVAIFTVPNYLQLEYTGRYYRTIGKIAMLYSARDNTEAKASFYWQSPPLSYDRSIVTQQKELLHKAFAGVGWQVPQLLQAAQTAPDFYFDSISQVHLERWARGRIVLVGDAAYCPSPLSGMGTPAAVLGAYVLAGELEAAGDDYATAFANYEREMRPFIREAQGSVAGATQFMFPSSHLSNWMGIQTFRVMAYLPKSMLAKMAEGSSNAIKLKDY